MEGGVQHEKRTTEHERYEAGESVWVDGQPSGSGYHDLLDLVSKGEFWDTGWNGKHETLKFTRQIDVYD